MDEEGEVCEYAVMHTLCRRMDRSGEDRADRLAEDSVVGYRLELAPCACTAGGVFPDQGRGLQRWNIDNSPRRGETDQIKLGPGDG